MVNKIEVNFIFYRGGGVPDFDSNIKHSNCLPRDRGVIPLLMFNNFT